MYSPGVNFRYSKAAGSNQYMGDLGDVQSFLNKILGATPDKPLQLPIAIPPIEVAQTTMDELAEMMYIGMGIIAGGIVAGAVVKGIIQR